MVTRHHPPALPGGAAGAAVDLGRMLSPATNGPATLEAEVALATGLAPRRAQPRVVGAVGAALLVGAVWLAPRYGARQSALFLVGAALGVVLYHAAFGFTAAFRALVTRGDGRGIRAQMLMLAVATVLFAPLLARGAAFGVGLGGAVAPASLSVLIGAFVFAIGMQLGGGCGSGTLFHLGAGTTPMVLTLAGFVGGSVLATWHAEFWAATPSLGEVSLAARLGWARAVAVQLVAFAAVVVATRAVERRRRLAAPSAASPAPARRRVAAWRPPPRLRLADCLRLQHRRLRQRHRLDEPARLALGSRSAPRHAGRGEAPPPRRHRRPARMKGASQMRYIGTVLVTIVVILGGVGLGSSLGADPSPQAGIVAGELSTIANQLSLRPDIAIDLTKVSGEYCFNAGLATGGHMTHYAADPTRTAEDVVDFVNAEPLVKAGINVASLPRFPGGLNSMAPGQWYFLPAGELEPHHGRKFPFPLLIRATNIK